MLEARNLTKRYGDFTALHPLTLTVRPGEIYCLLGANGAGKSTTINLFLDFVRPSGGAAFVNGLDVQTHGDATKQFLAYIPENLMLYPDLTGLENLAFFCGLAGKKPSQGELGELLREAGLQAGFANRRVAAYSKGMRQKVGIALAVAKDAKALLLDEPTSGLDPKASNEFSELLLRLRERGVATLMATHDLFRARDTGTHIGIMKDGRLLESFEASRVDYNELEELYLQHMHA
ncbi:ABC-2 type transport system ATP-binding protein [Hymenobacter sp. UYAg731]